MNRLLILYLLLEGDRSAYEIKQVLVSPYLRFWFHVEDPSIYSALKTLAKNGFATARRVGRATSYRITRKGVREFETSLRVAWETGDAKTFESALAVSGDMARAELKVVVERRLSFLEQRVDQLAGIRLGAMSPLLARKEQVSLDAEIRWLRQEQSRLNDE